MNKICVSLPPQIFVCQRSAISSQIQKVPQIWIHNGPVRKAHISATDHFSSSSSVFSCILPAVLESCCLHFWLGSVFQVFLSRLLLLWSRGIQCWACLAMLSSSQYASKPFAFPFSLSVPLLASDQWYNVRYNRLLLIQLKIIYIVMFVSSVWCKWQTSTRSCEGSYTMAWKLQRVYQWSQQPLLSSCHWSQPPGVC